MNNLTLIITVYMFGMMTAPFIDAIHIYKPDRFTKTYYALCVLFWIAPLLVDMALQPKHLKE